MDKDTRNKLATEALFRRGYLIWLAEQIERASDHLLRRDVAKVLRWVAEGVPEEKK